MSRRGGTGKRASIISNQTFGSIRSQTSFQSYTSNRSDISGNNKWTPLTSSFTVTSQIPLDLMIISEFSEGIGAVAREIIPSSAPNLIPGLSLGNDGSRKNSPYSSDNETDDDHNSGSLRRKAVSKTGLGIEGGDVSSNSRGGSSSRGGSRRSSSKVINNQTKKQNNFLTLLATSNNDGPKPNVITKKLPSTPSASKTGIDRQSSVISMSSSTSSVVSQRFDLDGFVQRIMSVDYSSSPSPKSEADLLSIDETQVVFSEPEGSLYAYVHHLTLHDVNARGFVRPIAISYVTSEPAKIMNNFEELFQEVSKVSFTLKRGNLLSFYDDIEAKMAGFQLVKNSLSSSQRSASKREEIEPWTNLKWKDILPKRLTEQIEELKRYKQAIQKALPSAILKTHIAERKKSDKKGGDRDGSGGGISSWFSSDKDKDQGKEDETLDDNSLLANLSPSARRKMGKHKSASVRLPSHSKLMKASGSPRASKSDIGLSARNSALHYGRLRQLSKLCLTGYYSVGTLRLERIHTKLWKPNWIIQIDKDNATQVHPLETCLAFGSSPTINFAVEPSVIGYGPLLTVASVGTLSAERSKSRPFSYENPLSPEFASNTADPYFLLQDADNLSMKANYESGAHSRRQSFGSTIVSRGDVSQAHSDRSPSQPTEQQGPTIASFFSNLFGGPSTDLNGLNTPKSSTSGPGAGGSSNNNRSSAQKSGTSNTTGRSTNGGSSTDPFSAYRTSSRGGDKSSSRTSLGPEFSSLVPSGGSTFTETSLGLKSYTDQFWEVSEMHPGAGLRDFAANSKFAVHIAYSLLKGRPVVVYSSAVNEWKVRALVNMFSILIARSAGTESSLATKKDEQTSSPKRKGSRARASSKRRAPGGGGSRDGSRSRKNKKSSKGNTGSDGFTSTATSRPYILPWKTTPLTLTDLTSIKLFGLSKSTGISKSVYKYVTVYDIEEATLWAPPYLDGQIIPDLLNVTKKWPDECTFLAHIHERLLDLSIKANLYYQMHTVGVLPSPASDAAPSTLITSNHSTTVSSDLDSTISSETSSLLLVSTTPGSSTQASPLASAATSPTSTSSSTSTSTTTTTTMTPVSSSVKPISGSGSSPDGLLFSPESEIKISPPAQPSSVVAQKTQIRKAKFEERMADANSDAAGQAFNLLMDGGFDSPQITDGSSSVVDTVGAVPEMEHRSRLMSPDIDVESHLSRLVSPAALAKVYNRTTDFLAASSEKDSDEIMSFLGIRKASDQLIILSLVSVIKDSEASTFFARKRSDIVAATRDHNQEKGVSKFVHTPLTTLPPPKIHLDSTPCILFQTNR